MNRRCTLFCTTAVLLAVWTDCAAQPGTIDPIFPSGAGANSTVFGVAVQNDQKIVLVGGFSTYNGVNVGRVVRVLPNGTIDPTFNPGGAGSNNPVYDVVIQPDQKILISGEIQTYNGTFVGRLIRLNSDGTRDTGFNSSAPSGTRNMALQSDGKVIYHTFTGLARLMTTGAPDPSFVAGAPGGGSITNIALQPDGKLVVIGTFTSWAGQTAGRIVRLLPDGTVDPSFASGTGFSNSVESIAISNTGDIYVGGAYVFYNGTFSNSLAKLTSSGALAPGWNYSGGNFVHSIALDPGGKIYAGRWFSIDVVRRLLPNGSLDPAFTPSPNHNAGAQIYEVALQSDGGVLLAGSFNTFNGQPRGGVARLNTCNSQWFLDNDHDGWGAAFTAVTACLPPPGYVDNDLDCDDNDANSAPTEWCVDVDSDGHGDPTNTIWACDQPLGTVPVGGACDDCNDDDAAIYPGAPCDDANACTVNDVLDGTCSCAGTFQDSDADGICDAEDDCPTVPGGFGSACDDGNACTINDVLQSDCSCLGTFQDTDADGICDAQDDCPTVPGQVGSPCNDGDSQTTNDVLQADCSCLGVPCTDVTFELITDANGSETIWQVLDATTLNVEMNGSNYPNNSACIEEPGCLHDGTHVLNVFDLGSGFSGGYLLRQGESGRIVHNSLGFSGTLAQLGTNGQFDMPVGTDHLIDSRCDQNGLENTDNLIAASNPAVAAREVPGGWSAQESDSGYEFWIFDPDGGYSKTVYRSLQVSDGGVAGQNNRARTLFLNHPAFTSNPVPLGVELNVRVRSYVDGAISDYGPACRLLVNGNTAAYWPSHLVDLPGDPLHSCNRTAIYDAANATNRIYAVSLTGGANYRFEWTRIGGGPVVTFTVDRSSGSNTNNRYMALSKANSPSWMGNWPTAQPDPQVGEVWSVRVAAKRFGTNTWSAYGPCCTITFVQTQLAVVEGGDLAPALMELWPNPNQDRLVHLSFSGSAAPGGTVQVDFTDAMGRVALARAVVLDTGEAATTLDLSHLAPGLYTVRAAVGAHHFVERLVVE